MLLVSLIWSSTTQAEVFIETLEAFNEDQEYVREEIVSSTLAQAWIPSTSALFHWKDYSDLQALTERTIVSSYAARSGQEVGEELKRRREFLAQAVNGVGWFDTGLLALAVGRYEEAIHCFTESQKDPEFKGNPYAHLFRGQAYLKWSRLEDGIQAYEQAIRSASTVPPVKFQISFMYAMDLYKNGQLPRAHEPGGPIQGSLDSEYPLERAFALYELLLRAWSQDHGGRIAIYVNSLKALLAETTPREDSEFEKRRFNQASELVQKVEAALGGDPTSEMILDEESCDFFFKLEYWEAAYQKLSPWVEAHPLSARETWDATFTEAVTWVHLNHAVAECLSGRTEDAEEHLVELTTAISFEDQPRRIVDAWCWLGHLYKMLGRYEEAVDAFDIGLGMDAQDSESVEKGLPSGPLQSRILGGRSTFRDSFVSSYRDALVKLQVQEVTD